MSLSSLDLIVGRIDYKENYMRSEERVSRRQYRITSRKVLSPKDASSAMHVFFRVVYSNRYMGLSMKDGLQR